MNADAKIPLKTERKLLPRVKGEIILTVLGLYLGIFLYYSGYSSWSLIGIVAITSTAFYLAYSLKYVNPTTLTTLNITRKKWGLYILIGLLLIIPAWFFESLYSHLTGRGWMSFGIASSPPLVLSILAIAISEEVFFRGYLLGRLKSLDVNRWRRIALVSILFISYKIFVHIWEGWPFALYVEFFVFGALKMLFETFWADWTGSVMTPIVIHIGWDLIMFQAYTGLPHWAL